MADPIGKAAKRPVQHDAVHRLVPAHGFASPGPQCPDGRLIGRQPPSRWNRNMRLMNSRAVGGDQPPDRRRRSRVRRSALFRARSWGH
jgi:hypothetical protein